MNSTTDLFAFRYTLLFGPFVKWFPPAAILGTTALTGSALLRQASPPRKPPSLIQCVFLRFGSGPQPLLYSVSTARPGRSLAQSSAGRHLRRKSSFSIRIVKFLNRLLNSIVTAPFIPSFNIGGFVFRSPASHTTPLAVGRSTHFVTLKGLDFKTTGSFA